MKMSRKFNLGIVFLIVVFLSSGVGPKESAAAFPEKPITLIVCFSPGGGTDTFYRKVAQIMEKKLGVPVIVKNISGAGGRRGNIQLFKSKPDGYTAGYAHYVPFFTDEFFLDKKPAIAYRKFALILKVTDSKHYLYVSKKSPFHSLEDLKKAGRPIDFAGSGIGTNNWVEAMALSAEVGFPVNYISGYKGLANCGLGVARGDAEMTVGSYAQHRAVKDDIRVLAFLANHRGYHYPNVPGINELGYPQLGVLGSPRTIAAPPGTPEDRLKVIRQVLLEACADEGFIKWAQEAGVSLNPEGPEEFAETLKNLEKLYRGLKPMMQKAQKK